MSLSASRATAPKGTAPSRSQREPAEGGSVAYVDKFKLGPKSNYMFKTYVPKIKDAKVGLESAQERPTFQQFIDYLLVTDVSEYNDHWIPFWLHCKICWMDYDIIGTLSFHYKGWLIRDEI